MNEPAKTTAVDDARRKIDGKFSTDGSRIFNTVSGQEIPEDEPLFLLRARDHHALSAINAYQESCEGDCNDLHLAGTQQVREKFCQFQAEHPERMKQPGITRHLKLEESASDEEPGAPETSGKVKEESSLRLKITELEAQLTAMTEDRDLWQNAHDDDCPNKAMLETVEAQLRQEREAKKRCHICQKPTEMACSDCRIDFGVTIYVCPECQQAHDAKCPEELRDVLETRTNAALKLQAQVAQLQTTIGQQATEIERLKEFEWMYKELCK